MTQVVIYWPLTVEAAVKSSIIHCGICGGQTRSRTDFLWACV